jgi:hypothetical protein
MGILSTAIVSGGAAKARDGRFSMEPPNVQIAKTIAKNLPVQAAE